MVHLFAVATYVQTHAVGVVFAVLASFVVGFLWHGPLFGKQWMKYNKIPMPKKGEVNAADMIPGIIASLVMAFVQAAVIGRTFQILALGGIGDALLIATLFWLPFTALTIVNEYVWAGRSWGHIGYDCAYNLASMWAIAACLYATL